MGVFFNRRVLLAGLLLSGCAAVPSRPPKLLPGDPDLYGELEPLLAVRSEADGLVIGLKSQGCLRKEDLRFFVDRKGGVPDVAFARRRLETCRTGAAPGEAEVRFGWGELGIADARAVRVLNPVG
ncbi:hypothetical protein DMC25_22715 [Caulobacter sp. D4A]|uniref:hypothetical protein n=1 Tax=unclassified Caulobacter TaxID=2648921 RepID=UPI000D7325C9|nr:MULTISPECIES: hypothetical protein [unclassified Caulobacter]PXA78102.1 hypothetical protein DMC25_22715 [Caulobacter sp. D4A]PXA92734.1 hypothetical protein DMC18_10330 [Caulobacter sp. D5]